MTRQSQKAGNDSTNIQTESITVVQGMSYPDVKEAALEVFRANFYELAGKAQDIAKERAEQITEVFFTKTSARESNGISKSRRSRFSVCPFYSAKRICKKWRCRLRRLVS